MIRSGFSFLSWSLMGAPLFRNGTQSVTLATQASRHSRKSEVGTPVLKLRRIELLGFKSFSDRGEIVVQDAGVTAIVGPNGCGKSNVSDAIAWVLGEQSAKSLRGEKMEDVIFNGTRSRAPMGMAEVTITLTETTPAPVEVITDPQKVNGHGSTNGHANGHANGHVNGHANGNGNGGPPAGPRDIVVQRRLYRDGESAYLIDGKVCRLRDIHEIFLGTGLGPNSYAIIEQGRIGPVSYTHLRAHETPEHLVCRLLLEKKKKKS